MAVAKEIRSKINSIRSTQKITRAMEMVAASKMQKAFERMIKSQPYAKKICQVINNIVRGNVEYRHPYLQARPVKHVAYIIVTSDRGLCGGLNNNLLKLILQHIKAQRDLDVGVQLYIYGSKGTHFFKRFGGNVVGQIENLGDAPVLTKLLGIVELALGAYADSRIDEIYICGNEFVNKMTNKPVINKIVPIITPEIADAKPEYTWDYIYEPDEAKLLLDMLLSRYIEAQVYRAVIENIACEQAARMLAMKNATDNATDLISELNLVYHKARQTTITSELSEIVAGASVL